MRYLDEITFIKKGSSAYNPDTGEYENASKLETVVRANITDLGLERSMKLFGSIKEGRKVVRLRPLIEIEPWDYLVYNGKTYQLVKDTQPQDRNSLIVEEFTNG